MAATQLHKAVVLFPPERHTVDRPSVILYGSIEKDVADWRTELASSLSDLPVAILNPHNVNWNGTWEEDVSFPKFKEQVEWEMDYAQVADVIAFHFSPATEAPVSLLELGMYGGTGKVVVHCDPRFKKKGNVQMVCLRYKIPLVYGLDGLEQHVRMRLIEKLEASSQSEAHG